MSKMRKCKTCGAEIAKSAKACPQCGAKSKPGCFRVVLAVFLLFFGMAMIVAALGGGEAPTKVSGSDTTNTASDAKDHFGVGDCVELKDVYVTLNSVTESDGSDYLTPESGKVFLICEFTIENNSDKDLAVSSLMSFEAYADDYAIQLDLSATASADKTQLDGTIAPGKKMNGIVGYTVTVDWNTFEIRYTPSLGSNAEIIFICEK